MKEINQYNQLQYVTQYPDKFRVSQKYPLLIYIHGAGGRGQGIDVLYNGDFFDIVEK